MIQRTRNSLKIVTILTAIVIIVFLCSLPAFLFMDHATNLHPWDALPMWALMLTAAWTLITPMGAVLGFTRKAPIFINW